MSQIARQSGIGRATLYKYFPDVEAVLAAWHERHIATHLQHLAAVSAAARPAARLAAVLREYARLTRQRRDGSELAALLHQGQHVTRAHEHLQEFVTALLREAAGRGEVRDDVPAGELAAYCLHALTAAAGLPSGAALGRLVEVTLDGLRRAGGAEEHDGGQAQAGGRDEADGGGDVQPVRERHAGGVKQRGARPAR
ncbi:MAG TPA: helix-turn-helix domain-containing protein [Streptosporangiaceae bacterium]